MGPVARAVVAPLPGLAGAFFCFTSTAMHGDDLRTGLHLYILALLPLVVLRVIFAKRLRQAGEKYITEGAHG
jgi:hypothetical protein